MEFGNALPYEIRISGSHNKGFLVHVGCCMCVFTDKKTMLAAIEDYINDPKKMTLEYNQSRGVDETTANCEPPTTGISIGPAQNVKFSCPTNEVNYIEDDCEEEDLRPERRR